MARGNGAMGYQAELAIFLPGYDKAESELSVHVNDEPRLPARLKAKQGGTLAVYRMYLPQAQAEPHLRMVVRYRPRRTMARAAQLTVTLPQREEKDDELIVPAP